MERDHQYMIAGHRVSVSDVMTASSTAIRVPLYPREHGELPTTVGNGDAAWVLNAHSGGSLYCDG